MYEDITDQEKEMLKKAKRLIQESDDSWIILSDNSWLDFDYCSEEETKEKEQLYLKKGIYDILHKIYQQRMCIDNIIKYLDKFNKINDNLPNFLQDEMIELVERKEKE